MCLYSLWGKFGQRNNLCQTKVIKDQAEFYQMMIDPSKEIRDVTLIKNTSGNEDEDLTIVSWTLKDECAQDMDFINPVISAYVTAQARLYLYSFLEKLGDRVLYCDTDSIIYIHRPGDLEIETGPYLGEMGDELESYGPGCYIDEFVCGE